jgi:hypothetical protein
MNIRHAVGTGSLVFLLFGCSDYQWTQIRPPSESYEWKVIASKDELHKVCAIELERVPRLAACAFQIRESGKCVVFSLYSEEEARRQYAGDQLSLWEHEMKHCQGFRHG